MKELNTYTSALADHCLALLLELICRRGAPCGHSSLHVPALLFPFIHYPRHLAKVKRKRGPRLCVHRGMRCRSARVCIRMYARCLKIIPNSLSSYRERHRDYLQWMIVSFSLSEITHRFRRTKQMTVCLPPNALASSHGRCSFESSC